MLLQTVISLHQLEENERIRGFVYVTHHELWGCLQLNRKVPLLHPPGSPNQKNVTLSSWKMWLVRCADTKICIFEICIELRIQCIDIYVYAEFFVVWKDATKLIIAKTWTSNKIERFIIYNGQNISMPLSVYVVYKIFKMCRSNFLRHGDSK